MVPPDSIAAAARLVAAARRTVALTGAGISTESGVPDFRSPTGVWSKYDPEEFSYQNFVARAEARRKYWRWSREMYPAMRDAEPNRGHLALAALERRGLLRCVITQNIDGLHQRAGSTDVIELHGNAMRVGCLGCGREWPRAEVERWMVEEGVAEPTCDACGGPLKPKTISFGQAMPEAETRRAFMEAQAADLLIAIGSSLVVFPAAALVPAAKQGGAGVIVVNMTPTDYDEIADVVLRGKAGKMLPAVLAALAS